MFRLVKLAAYILFGYAVYEFIVGLLQVEEENNRRSNPAVAGPSEQRPGKMNFTGPGEGQTVATTGVSGETAKHRVGRGVIAQ